MGAGNRKIAQKLLAFENLRPDAYIWLPDQSISGEYEALTGDDELIQDTDGRQFLRTLRQKVIRTRR
ncbi:MAG TPA: hypothetical protein VHZ03_26600 [Trebonia sp.]|nr:hypothetical protein [Trebonia sp.]